MRRLADAGHVLDRYSGERAYLALPILGPGVSGTFLALAHGSAVRLDIVGLSVGHACGILRAVSAPDTVLLALDPAEAEIVMCALSAWQQHLPPAERERFISLRGRLVSLSGYALEHRRTLAADGSGARLPDASNHDGEADLDTVGQPDILATRTGPTDQG